MSDLLSKLKLDKHHKIERFGVILSFLSVSMIIVLCTICFKHHKDINQELSQRVMYTQIFQSSLTGTTGTVERIYRNDANTKVFLLLKFDDVSKISTDAKAYQMFLSGSNQDMTHEDMTVKPTGTIYMFGSSGYMGIYLVENRGFDMQILDLTVRCNKTITAKQTVEMDPALYGQSFSDYDQFRIYFNPGGTDTTVSSVLNTNGPLDISELYERFVYSQNESSIRTALSNDLENMKLNLKQIEEYERRVKDAGVQLPARPSCISGDAIVMNQKTGMLYLETDHVFASGYDYDWQSKSISDGYIDDMCGDLTYTEFFQEKQYELNDIDRTRQDSMNMENIKWYYNDGTEVSLSTSEESWSNEVSLANDISNLTSAWNAFYNNKKQYQVTDLRKLLRLEADVRSVSSHFTINDDENVLTNW